MFKQQTWGRENCIESKLSRKRRENECCREMEEKKQKRRGDHRFEKTEEYSKKNKWKMGKIETTCIHFYAQTCWTECTLIWIELTSIISEVIGDKKVWEKSLLSSRFRQQPLLLERRHAAYLQPWELHWKKAERALMQSLWIICIPFDMSFPENNSLLHRSILRGLFL